MDTIAKTQRREIKEMDWLINDIKKMAWQNQKKKHNYAQYQNLVIQNKGYLLKYENVVY